MHRALEEYLGPMTWYMDVMLDMDEGGESAAASVPPSSATESRRRELRRRHPARRLDPRFGKAMLGGPVAKSARCPSRTR
jgi:ethylbenzene dioxygenase alpha subunit